MKSSIDKKKQIEELSEIQLNLCHRKMCGVADCEECLAEEIYNAGYRKIPEGVVVLKDDEYERWQGQTLNIKKVRKETAEKFAEMALREIKAISAKSEYLLDDESVYEDSSLENVLEKVKNEICKEFTGDKDEKG